MTEKPRDVVQEYLDRLRSMGPSDRMLRDIDEVEEEHRRELAEQEARRQRVKLGFRGNHDR
ncbi:hypothetical protein [Terrabacter sp. MAHUQ-38]|uniref:hypothetical protein n=1 Tax=unclassified Terrabacter TaxID=2630222 RepID=UPI00165D986B|nr:hypothetical protein [Terrabacter sp. MAHUQ-38]MBC9819741.1 hypothetical protein [Terrabacter sp. MAHUQ-38]